MKRDEYSKKLIVILAHVIAEERDGGEMGNEVPAELGGRVQNLGAAGLGVSEVTHGLPHAPLEWGLHP